MGHQRLIRACFRFIVPPKGIYKFFPCGIRLGASKVEGRRGIGQGKRGFFVRCFRENRTKKKERMTLKICQSVEDGGEGRKIGQTTGVKLKVCQSVEHGGDDGCACSKKGWMC